MTALTPASGTQDVTLLSNLGLPSLARPLAVIGDHTYAAIWAYLDRGVPARSVAPQLLLVRDDGRLLDSPSRLVAGQPQAILDWFIPDYPPLPADRLWSGHAVQRYRDGQRPDPAVVFASLVTVLQHFVDFTASLASPDLMAEFFAVYVLTTWFSPVFPFHGLLWLTGDNGSGKSRLLFLLSRLAHLGQYLSAPPPASTLRSLASLGAALAVDDAHDLAQHASGGHSSIAARNALLLAGRQRGALLPVTLAGSGRRSIAGATRQLDVSGPRLFANVQPPHSSIARHFIVIPLVRTALASLAAADPGSARDWPPGLTLTGLVDDLWALGLSRLHELPPHLTLAAQASASAPNAHLPPPTSHISPPTSHLPLIGAELQPWHALLATASWLSSCGVPGLLDRLLGLAQVYHAARPAAQTADVTVLALRAIFACLSAVYDQLAERDARDALAAYERAHGIQPGEDLNTDGADDASDANDANDANDAKSQNVARRLEQRIAREDWRVAYYTNPDRVMPAFPSSFAIMSTDILDAMRRLASESDPDLALDHLTPSLVGRLLRQLRLQPHRNSGSRHWIITPVDLARLARAYGVPIPPHLVRYIPPADPPNPASP